MQTFGTKSQYQFIPKQRGFIGINEMTLGAAFNCHIKTNTVAASTMK
jgi:hypothetical protein